MDNKHGKSLNRKALTEADKKNFKALSMDERNELAMASCPRAVPDQEASDASGTGCEKLMFSEV